jgi:NadR type nicotinamide-nucleotide adenylyltransferase
MFAHALVVGKFLPPHLGHHSLINCANAQAARVTVVVCDNPVQVPSAGIRATWLQEVHPFVDVIIVPDICVLHQGFDCPLQCSDMWAIHLQRAGVRGVDLICANETYGEPFAKAMRATWKHFDIPRSTITVSGTQVRADLAGSWKSLHPVVRSGLYRKLVVLGAESTGTTTLVRDVSQRLGASQTFEEGRTMAWELASRAGGIANVQWTDDIFASILLRQRALEERACMLDATKATLWSGQKELGPWLICDTDALATLVWWERYLTTPTDFAAQYSKVHPGELYVITSPDGVLFNDDTMRDGEHLRQSMHQRFIEVVKASGQPYIVVEGDRSQRVDQTLAALQDYESSHPRFILKQRQVAFT